jgi:hypothetical protein
MKYRIEKQETGISIRIDDVAGQEQAILETIRLCRRQSVWACPSGECQNIGSMEERAESGSVFLTLTATAGATIDPSGIDECLRYVLHQAVKV